MKKLLLVLTFLLSAIYSGSRGIEQPVYLPEMVLKFQTEEQQVYNAVRKLGYSKFVAKLIVAQAKHESGNFKSRLYLNHSNAFGMMYPKRRHTIAISGEARAEGRTGYAVYNNLTESTEDIILFLKYKGCNFKFKTVAQYVNFLKKVHYFTADKKQYQNAIYHHYKQIKV